jgi:Zn-dependent membrane protease YugP
MLFDPIYWLILGVCGLMSLLASLYVKSAFRSGAEVPIQSGLTGAEVARRILRDQDIVDVEVHEHQGFLSDHYNPSAKTLNLSPDVYHGRTAAAAGVAAHEVGHALQHAQGDVTMWARTILVYPANFGSMLGPYVVMGGIAMGSASQVAQGHHGAAYWVALSGVLLFGIATACSIFIVFNEFNASARARVLLVKLGVTRAGEEDATVARVLNAAGLTYLAAAAGSLLNLLYWAWQAGLLGGGRRDD